MLYFHIVTLFPEMFPGPLSSSLAGKAKGAKWDIKIYNPRDYTTDKHCTVDDKPFGGGAGMVMKPDVAAAVIEAIKSYVNIDKLIYFSPRGELLNQEYINKISLHNNYSNILIFCGRFEGIDQRIIDFYGLEEISAGDFILSGGEIPAMMLIDACIRMIPGVINNQNALTEESFLSQNEFSGLLEYPLYTRPSSWNGLVVPNILLSGNHQKIKEWKLDESKKITQKRRPDLWKRYYESSLRSEYE